MTLPFRIGRRRIVALIAAVMAALSHPSEAAGQAYVLGAGSESCGKMLSDVAETEEAKRLYVTWVLGFFTAASFWHRAHVDDLDAEGIFAWMMNYCQSHPLSQVAMAASVLLLREKRLPPQ